MWRGVRVRGEGGKEGDNEKGIQYIHVHTYMRCTLFMATLYMYGFSRALFECFWTLA